MKKNKKNFNYKNKIILTNGSSLKITSVKYIKNYQLNFEIFENKKINDNTFKLDKNQFNKYINIEK